jgi:hypothetical protein
MADYETVQHDVLVIGAGGAGYAPRLKLPPPEFPSSDPYACLCSMSVWHDLRLI